MATIANAIFNSEDEEADGDYVYSGSSDDEAIEEEHGQHISLRNPIDSKSNETFDKLLETAAISSVHVHTRPDQFMLQFQRKSQRLKPRHTPTSIMSFVRTSLGDYETTPERFNISDYKSKCRAEEDAVPRTAAETSIDYENLAKGDDVLVTEFVRYAGNVYQTQKRVRKESLGSDAAKRHGQGASGGLLDVNALLSKVTKAKNVTSVEKSLSDWRSHKGEDVELEESLRQNRKDGYLGRQEFLFKSDVKRDIIFQQSQSKRRPHDASGGNFPGPPIG